MYNQTKPSQPPTDSLFDDVDTLNPNPNYPATKTPPPQAPSNRQRVATPPIATKQTSGGQTPTQVNTPNTKSKDRQDYPLFVETVAPICTAWGLNQICSILTLAAAGGSASLVTPILYLLSPIIAPFAGAAAIVVCHRQGWVKPKRVVTFLFIGWGLSLIANPILLAPLANKIPTLESLQQKAPPSNSPDPL